MGWYGFRIKAIFDGFTAHLDCWHFVCWHRIVRWCDFVQTAKWVGEGLNFFKKFVLRQTFAKCDKMPLPDCSLVRSFSVNVQYAQKFSVKFSTKFPLTFTKRKRWMKKCAFLSASFRSTQTFYTIVTVAEGLIGSASPHQYCGEIELTCTRFAFRAEVLNGQGVRFPEVGLCLHRVCFRVCDLFGR